MAKGTTADVPMTKEIQKLATATFELVYCITTNMLPQLVFSCMPIEVVNLR